MNMAEMLSEMIARSPAPCADCDAEQAVLDLGGGLHTLTIFHDSSCPAFLAMRGQ